MQGRLSKSLTGRIQEFPLLSWREEFELAHLIGIKAIEWTVDFKDFNGNPIFTSQNEIADLKSNFGVLIPSITLDCFVEAPIHKRNELTGLASKASDLEWVAQKLGNSGVDILVLPIVAESGKFSSQDLESLLSVLKEMENTLSSLGKRVAIECEFETASIAQLLAELDDKTFGINFDMGNSAALGHDPVHELEICKGRLFNVHIKDRVLSGSTVPLGTGSVQFKKIASILEEQKYSGNMILQAARDFDRSEIEQIRDYITFCRSLGWADDE